MKTSVHSSQLQFTRDGRTLVVAEPDGVAFVEVRGDGRRRIAIPGVQAVAAFADQVWVATRTGALIRLGTDGRRLDEHALPIDPDGLLIPATIGGPAALWTGREAVALLDALGSLAIVPGDLDAAIPIAGRRFVRSAGPRLTLPAGTTVTLAGAVQIAGGSVIIDGTSLALVAEHPRGRDLIVVALASGRALQRVALPPGTVRIAARRGLAVVHDAARRLTLLDLRFGRPLGAVVSDDDVTDVAVDPDGTLLAIRRACSDLELAPIGERARGATRLSASLQEIGPRDAEVAPLDRAEMPMPGPSSEHRSSEAQAAEPRPAESRSSDRPPADPLAAVVVDALEPRPIRERLPRAAALVELDREIRSVMLWALRAISSAWDTRRLGYGNEGAHPYEHEVAALLGKNAGFAQDYRVAARDAVAEHEAALAADPQHRSAPTPIAELADELGLSPVAIDVLLVIAAPSLHGDVARLYGILGNDPGRAMVDELLVQHVLGDRVSRHDVAAELHPRAPLVRLGIVGVKPSRPRPFAALEVDPVVLSRLRGEPPELGAAPAVRHADRALAALELAPGVLASAIDALARAARPARIAVRGRAGSGRRTLLAAFAQRAGRALGVIDATGLPRDAERFAPALKTALRRAQLAGLVPVVHGLDAVVFDQRNGAELAHEIRSRKIPKIWQMLP
jgi:hypothetical protein